MKILRSPVVIALLFCLASYGYSAHDGDIERADSINGSAFYANFWDRFKTTGAIAPSSRFLAREITKDIALEPPQGKVLQVLEIGAGDGVFTAALVEQLDEAGVDYQIHAVDIDPTFLAALKARFDKNKRVVIHAVDITKASNARVFGFSAAFTFDVIISGLPHYADFFSAQAVDAIFTNYKKLLKQGGLLRWFSYVAAATFADLKHLLQGVTDGERLDFEKKCAVINNFKNNNGVTSSEPILLNWPPARVYECRIFHQPCSPRRSPRLQAV